VERALTALRAGEFVVVTDGSDRENEGDLIIAAEKATPEKIAFMVNETSGLICVGVESARLAELELPQMVVRNTESHATAFTVRASIRTERSTFVCVCVVHASFAHAAYFPCQTTNSLFAPSRCRWTTRLVPRQASAPTIARPRCAHSAITRRDRKTIPGLPLFFLLLPNI
jgi:hypothetical protein